MVYENQRILRISLKFPILSAMMKDSAWPSCSVKYTGPQGPGWGPVLAKGKNWEPDYFIT